MYLLIYYIYGYVLLIDCFISIFYILCEIPLHILSNGKSPDVDKQSF